MLINQVCLSGDFWFTSEKLSSFLADHHRTESPISLELAFSLLPEVLQIIFISWVLFLTRNSRLLESKTVAPNLCFRFSLSCLPWLPFFLSFLRFPALRCLFSLFPFLSGLDPLPFTGGGLRECEEETDKNEVSAYPVLPSLWFFLLHSSFSVFSWKQTH